MCLCRDLSHACIGMFESHQLHPYCMNDLWTTVHKMISFLACIWHINSFRLVLTSHVVNFIHCNTHTRSLDLYPRATSVCMPLQQRLVGLCHDISHACIGMFENLLLLPYCMDDLWTSVHHPDIGHCMCHHKLATLEFRLSSFQTP